ncbi:MAG TPA: DNA polymerase III subunit delta' [Actinomycetaceae bacterium]|nr:DNA polymerase III subunit delta' [Actinomycetaceae bacterium]
MSVWDALVGQDHVVETLSNAVEDRRAMTHAWLITGPPGSGRSVAARAFAAALQCEQNPAGCGECKPCRTVLAGTHPDVVFVATDQVVIKMDEVRALVLTAARSASQGRWRIIVVEDADRMLERTSNVLLKSIEEPAVNTVWLLCAPSPDDVIVTIRSRCRQIGLRIPDPQAVADLLVRRDGVDPDLALKAARAAQSHVGIAKRLATNEKARERRRRLLMLPNRIRGVGDAVFEAAGLVEESAADAKSVAAQLDGEERAELLRTLGIEEGTSIPPAIRSQIRHLEENQKKRGTRVQRDALDRAMTDLLSFYRDVVIVQLGSDVPLVNEDLADEISAVAAESTPEQTVRRMDAIGQARTRLEGNVAPLLAVEAMLIALRPRG